MRQACANQLVRAAAAGSQPSSMVNVAGVGNRSLRMRHENLPNLNFITDNLFAGPTNDFETEMMTVKFKGDMNFCAHIFKNVHEPQKPPYVTFLLAKRNQRGLGMGRYKMQERASNGIQDRFQ